MTAKKSSKPAPEATDQRKAFTVRFRLTAAEMATISVAAEADAKSLETELTDRGLPDSMIQTLKRPSDWSRYVVLKAAKKKVAELNERQRQQLREEAARRVRGSIVEGGMTFDEQISQALEFAQYGILGKPIAPKR